jgi:hypothetical protein
MDQVGQAILLGILALLAVILGIWWKFIRGHETNQAKRTAGTFDGTIFKTQNRAAPPRAPWKVRAPRIVKGLGLMLLVFALAAALGCGVNLLSRYHTLQSWPRTQAQVLSSEIYSRRYWSSGSRGRTAGWYTDYGFHCTVQYSVLGQQYNSVADLGIKAGFRGSLDQWPSRFPSGTNVFIAYNPADPSSVILAGDFRTAYAPAFLGFWLVGIFLSAGAILLVTSKTLQNHS